MLRLKNIYFSCVASNVVLNVFSSKTAKISDKMSSDFAGITDHFYLINISTIIGYLVNLTKS